MVGLRTQESNKFKKFFNIIQESASKQGKKFFLDSGIGNEFENEELEGENLQGWLIPNEKSESFIKEFENDSVDDDKWGGFFSFAIWEAKSNNIVIKFE